MPSTCCHRNLSRTALSAVRSARADVPCGLLPLPPATSDPARIRHIAVVSLLALLLVSWSPCPVSAQLNRTLHQDGWILAAAHAPGRNGSIWRTDLWMRARTYGTGSATLYFCQAGEDGTAAPGHALEFATGENIVYVEDVVANFLDVGDGSWLGAIHYVSDNLVQVYARVYSISPDGSQTYGQLVEGIPTADMSLATETPGYPSTRENQWMTAMKHTADGRYRVNIGIVNPTPVASAFWVDLFDGTGERPAGFAAIRLQLPPFSMTQLNDPYADVSDGEWDSYVARVEAETEGSGVFAYASVVDNATNDAFFVRGVKLMQPDE